MLVDNQLSISGFSFFNFLQFSVWNYSKQTHERFFLQFFRHYDDVQNHKSDLTSGENLWFLYGFWEFLNKNEIISFQFKISLSNLTNQVQQEYEFLLVNSHELCFLIFFILYMILLWFFIFLH